jgi:hypothetical protein
MAIPNRSGYYDSNQGVIRPTSTDTWTAHASSTWDAWTSWDTPNTEIVWNADIIDLGRVKSFCLNITTTSTGLVDYKIYTSDTGVFAGEETETLVVHGSSETPDSFVGQYVLVIVIATYQGTELTLTSIQTTPQADTVIELAYAALDTSTLAGTSSARTIALTRQVSKVLEVIVTPHAVTSYNLDLYVSSTQTSTQVVPRIVSKASTGPVIALVGLDNQPRDGVVDVIIKALPIQKLVGNNLVTS